jgi:hypothetical protein
VPVGGSQLPAGAHLIAESRETVLGKSARLVIVVQDGDIIVSVSDFYAVYYKPTNQPQLILRRRTDTENHELLAQAWRAANDKARELGWIV